MIYQEAFIPEYDWRVRIYYSREGYRIQEILDSLRRIGCSQDCLEDARVNMLEGGLNSGFCYSCPVRRESIMVIAKTSSKEQFMNSMMHEARHLASHIEQECRICPSGEESAVLSGLIGQKMYAAARHFL